MSDIQVPKALQRVIDAINTADTDVTKIRSTWVSRVFTGESSRFVAPEGGRVASFRIPPHA